MITAQELIRITNLSPHDLMGLVAANIESTEFVGVTNGGQFCYKIVLPDGVVSKAFITRRNNGDLGAELL
jgi:hypothetical protein